MRPVVTWEEPPAVERSRGGKWQQIAAELRTRPGRWARIYVGKRNTCSVAVSEIKNRVKPGFATGRWEATLRRVGEDPATACAVYARYLGEDQL